VAVVVVNTAAAAAVAVATNPSRIFRAGFGANRTSPFSLSRSAFACPSAAAFPSRQVAVICQPMKEEHIEVEGRVMTVLPGTMFRVELDNKHLVLATICGKMRKRWVRLTVGDRVKMDMSPYDLNKARITWRLR
jgi:translation initiation factor IF-1